MDSRVHLYILVFLSCTWRSSAVQCTIKDRNGCIYTVVCEGRPGSAYNPSCGSDVQVTFIIKDSTIETLTMGFFGATNFDSRVRRIEAIDNTWHNIESNALKYYTRCVDLDLSNNDIRNINNYAFKFLLVLQNLNLSRNAIEYLNTGSFVVSETGGNKIKMLDLSNNLLTEIRGDTLSKMTNLNRLELQNNKIKTLADDCFVNLRTLTILNLRNNRLTTLNMALTPLTSLQGLDLAYNSLMKLSGFEINRLSELIIINASNNAIEDVETNCFNLAFRLKSLDLSNNKIKSTIDNLMFINNNELLYLNLYNNSIEHIQDDAFKHNDLITLNLDKNNLKGDVTDLTFNGLSNVTRLDLFNQSIVAVRNGAFSATTSLIYLNLSKNAIDILENSSFTNALSLTVLDVSYNNISNLDFLKDSLEGLTELYLKSNQLSKIEQGAFLNQSNLKKLDLSMNFIITIEQYSLPLLNLQYLNLTGNFLNGSLKSNLISPSKYLRYLDLDSFNIKRIEDDVFIDSRLVARVNLSHNEIEFVGPINFINMDNLYSLDLSYNRLVSLELNELINLKSLYLQNNKLEDTSSLLPNTSKLVYLDISNNNIFDPILQTLDNLRFLRASNNKIKQFNNPHTNSFKKLMTLSLSSNALVNLNLSYFPDLIDVDLSNNGISIINSSFFQNLDNLQSIDLSFNNITNFIPGTFQNLKILKFLNLSANYISNLRYGSFKGLGRTEVIDISRNAIHALDVYVFHECTELKRLIIDYNFITQLDFERLVTIATNLNSLSLGGNPILCQEIVRNYNSVAGGRRVEVTSIHKMFQEDNVHGIWCGTGTMPTTTAAPTELPSVELSGAQSVSNVLLVWCTVLTIVMVIAGVCISYYNYRRNRVVIVNDIPDNRRSCSTEFEYRCESGELLLHD